MFKVQLFEDKYYSKWNNLVEGSSTGTIFHRLDFLAYHKDKFSNEERHIVWLKGEELFAVLPLAVFEKEGKLIAKSPYGGSYGGIVTRDTEVSFKESRELIDGLFGCLIDLGVDEFVFTPSIDLSNSTQILLFEILRRKGNCINSDANSIIPLLDFSNIASKHFTSSGRRHFKKGEANGIEIDTQSKDEDAFWTVLQKTFQKFEIGPTHSKEEWSFLLNEFPDLVQMDIAYKNGMPIAALGRVRIKKDTDSSFYILQDPEYQHLQGLTYLFGKSLDYTKPRGINYFDLGTSSVQMMPRENIFRFKESLGAKTYLRNSYSLGIK